MGRRVVALSLLLLGCPGDDPDPGPREWSQALDVGMEGGFLSVWGPASDNAWAVGGQIAQVGDAGTALIYRRGDAGWSKSEPPAGTPLLNWVHGHGETQWAVGNAGAALRYDGAAWQSEPTGIDVPLWGTFVFSAHDVWAVGGDAFDTDTTGVILHHDGAAWTEAAVPMLDRSSAAFFKVWGTAPDNVFAVGDSGVIVRFDGSEWAQVDSGTQKDLISLWGTGPDDILAVGGRDSAALVRWDGTAWTAAELDPVSGLNGVWLDAEGTATVVGNMGTAAVVPAGALSPDPQVTGAGFNVLHGVYGFDDGALQIAVGGSIDRSPPWVGVIFEY